MRDATLCFLIKDSQILLAMKKRGFGAGKINGYGGKPNPGELIEDTLIRETLEEAGVKIDLDATQKVAVIEFYFPDVPVEKDWNQTVHVYFSESWIGEPVESEEMSPKWYDLDKVDVDKMWAADKIWLKKVLNGQRIHAKVHFNGKGESIKSYEDVEVNSFD